MAAMFGRRAALLTLVFSLALAPGAVEWRWEAPANCSVAGATERRFAALAPEGCLRAQAEPLRVAAVASRVDRMWRLDLTLRRGDREVVRSLTARDCAALVEATAVIAATACPELDERPADLSPGTDEGKAPAPAATEVPDAPVPVAEATAPREPPARPDAPMVAEVPKSAALAAPAVAWGPEVRGARGAPSPPSSRAPGIDLGARIAAAWGPTPTPSLLAGLMLRVQWPLVDLLVAVDGGPRRRVGASAGPGIDLRLASVSLAGCPTLELGRGRRRGRASLCLGLELGALIGTGVGTPITRTAAQPWLAAVLGPSLGWSLHRRINIGAAVDVAASLTRPAHILEGYALGYRASAATVRLRMILTVQLR